METAAFVGNDMTTPNSQRRWYHPTPAWLVLGLLVVEGLLWLSERFQWFAFNEHKGWTVLIGIASVAVFLLLMFLWFTAAVLFRLLFQFSIRSLLVLTIAVAIPSGWLSVEMKKARRQAAAIGAIVSLGGQVTYDWQEFRFSGNSIVRRTHPEPKWLLDILGEDPFVKAIRAEVRNDRGIEAVRELADLEELAIVGPDVTDAGLKNLGQVTQIRKLNLAGTRFMNPGGSNCPRQITDAGLEHVNGLTQLKTLELGNQITDAGLERLTGLHQLRELYLVSSMLRGCPDYVTRDYVNPHVTDDGVKKLQQALPNCTVIR
jgi:hypothetical protein